jgi:hypothetical protein
MTGPPGDMTETPYRGGRIGSGWRRRASRPTAMNHGAKNSGVQKRTHDSPDALFSYGNVFQHSRCFGKVQARIASTGPIAPFVISSMIRLMM